MITKYLTEVTAKFNPFSKRAKAARIFLSCIPADARAQMKITTSLLPPHPVKPTVLDVKFKDGKEMKFDLKELRINDIVEQVDRHSRLLARKEDLAG
ncbi:hypothetical protein BT63DRAFT_420648 [Microthyrium microscopicum]|uniref:Large ribosomal subunit protein mL53 n=1 Tax=Microthyrium microscopicum TaxID=703497 RepID=A0A6A6USZ8_9PEZI|nr:hypothetical protein BT63DRAFT_420648 [Microthyrium microscopicum]